MYITGTTESTNFPTHSSYQSNGVGSSDVWVMKFSSSGSSLIYSSYIGGGESDRGYDICVNSENQACITGSTESSDFPTVNPYQSSWGIYGSDAFVVVISSSGSALVGSSYLGGEYFDYGRGITVDSIGCLYAAGYTESLDFPTLNPYQANPPSPYASSWDVFIAKLSSSASSIMYSTYFGGCGWSEVDMAYDIGVDPDGNAYITGNTSSSSFPTCNPYQASYSGGSGIFGGDVFVAKFAASGSTLIFSSYLGSFGDDYGFDIYVDQMRSPWISGKTYSDRFPTENPYQSSRAGAGDDAVITRFSLCGSLLLYSSYLGGEGDESGNGISIDSGNQPYLVGKTTSTDFPTRCSYQAQNAGSNDAFYLGGSGDDAGQGLVLDPEGKMYVIGCTDSDDFPVYNSYQASKPGSGNAFLSALEWKCCLMTPTPFGFPTPTPEPPPTSTPPPVPSPPPTPLASGVESGDYDGDGTAELALFRDASALWAARGITRVFYGTSGDIPVTR